MIPFTGLGNYAGMRGNRWLRNRIEIFKRFVVPSLLNQTDQEFVLWICFREEERNNKHVKALQEWFVGRTILHPVFSFAGAPMYDDKYENTVAVDRLAHTLNWSLADLLDPLSECDNVIWMMQPSDDCYDENTVASVKKALETSQAVVFEKGYLCNYNTKEVLEYNPKTTPPFAAIKFDRKTFFDPAAHLRHISLKKDTEKYKKGTPLPSHEYLPDCVQTDRFEGRGFLVGTHGENISTHFNHPYGGAKVDPEILRKFGIAEVPPLSLPISLRKWVMRRLPYPVQRKLRFWFGEIIGNKLYNFLRA